MVPGADRAVIEGIAGTAGEPGGLKLYLKKNTH